MRKTGWLLDANIDYEKEALTLWIKHEGKTRGYTYRGFHPSIFVSTDMIRSGDWSDSQILRSVLEHPKIVDSEIVRKFVSVYDDEKTPVLQVLTTPEAQREVAADLEKLPGAIVFHVDIDAVQQLFIAKNLFAFGNVEFELRGEDIVHIECLDDRDNPEYDLPEFEEMDFEVLIDTDQIFPVMEDRIHHIDVYHRGNTIRIDEEDEGEILRQFQETLNRIDPDVIVSRGGDEKLFRYLSIRATANGMDLILSRDGKPLRVTQGAPQSFWQYNRIVYRSGPYVILNW